MQSSVQAQNKRPLTTSQHPGLVFKTTSPVLFVWSFLIFYSLFSCFFYISVASKLEYLCWAPDWARPCLPHGKDFLPVSCLSASGVCGWSEAARVEMKGIRGNTAQQTLCLKIPTGIREHEHCWNQRQKFRPWRTEQIQTWYKTERLCSKRGKCTPAVPGLGGSFFSCAQAVYSTAATRTAFPPGLHQGACHASWP